MNQHNFIPATPCKQKRERENEEAPPNNSIGDIGNAVTPPPPGFVFESTGGMERLGGGAKRPKKHMPSPEPPSPENPDDHLPDHFVGRPVPRTLWFGNKKVPEEFSVNEPK